MLVDEDFSDGLIDDFGTQYGQWSFAGQAAFRPTNGRPELPMALSSRPNFSNGPWTDRADWRVPVGGSQFDFQMHKTDEVVITKFTGFSDIARSSRRHYGIEVALLETTDDPAFQGNPHFGHDLSFEAFQGFSTVPASQSQLEANVENTTSINTVTTNAHFEGASTDAALDNHYENLVIYRNRPGEGQSNIEQWGALQPGDYYVPSEMNGLIDPTSEYAVFDLIQITFFRDRNTAGELLRSGVTGTNAQIGMSHVQVGITRRTDFNLDYGVGMEDYFALAAGWGEEDRTMLTGDATNDGMTDAADFALLVDDWGMGDSQEVTRYTYDQANYQPSDELILEVHIETGVVRLLGNQTLLTGYQITSDGGLVAGAADHLWQTEAAGIPLHASTADTLNDLDLSGSTIDSETLGEAYDVLADKRDLRFLWQGALGETTRVGQVVYVEGVAGDFNSNGVVDAADYTVWRDGLGSDYIPGEYLSWAANYGATAISSTAAVPEPAAALPLAALFSLCVSCRGRSQASIDSI